MPFTPPTIHFPTLVSSDPTGWLAILKLLSGNKYNEDQLRTAALGYLMASSSQSAMTESEYEFIVFDGKPLGSNMAHGINGSTDNLADHVTNVQMSLSMDQVAQIVFTIEDPGLTYYKADIFSQGNQISYKNQAYIVSTCDVNGGGSTIGGVTVTCRSKGVQALKERVGPFSMPNAYTSDFVIAECQAVGMPVVVQQGALRSYLSREVQVENQTYSEDETPSSWTTFQTFAENEGYVLFECYGVLFYCKPSWLYQQAYSGATNSNMSTIGMYWNSPASEIPNLGGYTGFVGSSANAKVATNGLRADSNTVWVRAQEVPDVTVTYDQQQGPAWTVTAPVPIADAQRFYLGQRLILRGMGKVNELAALLVSGIDYTMAGPNNATITATSPYDPKPPVKQLQTNGQGTAGTSVEGLTLKPGKYGGQDLNAAQLNNAIEIYRAGQDKKMTVNDIVSAFATGYVESSMRILSNADIPESMKLPSDGTAPGLPNGAPLSDHSLGIFQQRDSWGSVAQRMSAHDSAVLYFNRVLTIPNRSRLQIGVLCQDVQGSANPDRYQMWVPFAQGLYQSITSAAKSQQSSTNADGWSPGHPVGTKRAADFVTIALKQVGTPYIYAYQVSSLKPVPSAFDCSLLVQWAAYQVGVTYPRDTYSQLPWCQNHNTMMSVEEGLNTRGAVFFKPDNSHTGISLGDGKRTVEAYDVGIGVIVNSPSSYGYHWGYAAKIPNMIYP